MAFTTTHKLTCDGCDHVLYDHKHDMAQIVMPVAQVPSIYFHWHGSQYALCNSCGQIMMDMFKVLFMRKSARSSLPSKLSPLLDQGHPNINREILRVSAKEFMGMDHTLKGIPVVYAVWPEEATDAD